VVDLVLDEPDDFAEGVGRPAAPALDGVWGRGTLGGFRCNRKRVAASFRYAGTLSLSLSLSLSCLTLINCESI